MPMTDAAACCSGSMAFEENGERIQDLKVILQRAAEVQILPPSLHVAALFLLLVCLGRITAQCKHAARQRAAPHCSVALHDRLDGTFRPLWQERLAHMSAAMPLHCVDDLPHALP